VKRDTSEGYSYYSYYSSYHDRKHVEK